jgi:hypothetical protein
LAYFGALYRGRLQRKWAHIWDELVTQSTNLAASEFLPDIRIAYQDELVDPRYIGLDDVLAEIEMSPALAISRLAEDRLYSLVDDAAEEVSGWAAYLNDEPVREPPPVDFKPVVPVSLPAKPKIGRNEPCPCGSGKKYKKCCSR